MRMIVVAALLAMWSTPQATAQQGAISHLAWMAGCHELRAGTRVTHEQWMAPMAGMMLGMSRTVVRDTVREFEQLRIETRNGQVVYVAQPSGQAETVFTGELVSDTLVVFSNPSHDFPQRVIYRKAGSDSVVARIEGTMNGAPRGTNFPMRRVSCTGGSGPPS